MTPLRISRISISSSLCTVPSLIRERLVRSPLPIGNLTSNGDSPDEQLQRPSEDRPCRKLNLLDALECIGACWAE